LQSNLMKNNRIAVVVATKRIKRLYQALSQPHHHEKLNPGHVILVLSGFNILKIKNNIFLLEWVGKGCLHKNNKHNSLPDVVSILFHSLYSHRNTGMNL